MSPAFTVGVGGASCRAVRRVRRAVRLAKVALPEIGVIQHGIATACRRRWRRAAAVADAVWNYKKPVVELGSVAVVTVPSEHVQSVVLMLMGGGPGPVDFNRAIAFRGNPTCRVGRVGEVFIFEQLSFAHPE